MEVQLANTNGALGHQVAQHQFLATGCVGVWCGVSNFPNIHLQDEWLLVLKGIFQRNVQM